MDIVFYNCNSERNKLNKNLTNPLTLTGTLRNATSVRTPSITVESSVSIIGYNYCYIAAFGRYYYVSNITIVHNDLYQIDMIVDVLMSFKNDILATAAIIDHTSEISTTDYMSSNIWETLVKDKTDIINFPSGLSETGGYVLITAGG